MKRIPVLIDCDPGVDDAAALLLANQIPELDIQAVTTVAGNVEVEQTTVNAQKIRSLINETFPIYRGAEKPMVRTLVTAPEFHGADGLGGVFLEMPQESMPTEKAWDAIYRIAKAYDGELTLITLGPLTNIGIALAKYRELPALLKRIVMMGGAAVGGNVTPAAEFNIYVDPEAADMVFCCGVPVVMCGLDVTMQAYLTPEETEEIGALGSPQARIFREIFQDSMKKCLAWGRKGVALHDPAAVLYAVYPDLFTAEKAGVRVETKGMLTVGKTVTDLYSDQKFEERNAFVLTDVDRAQFLKTIRMILARYGNQSDAAFG